MKKFYKLIAATFIAALAVTGLSGCAAKEPVDMSTYAAVIDVRTPEEFSTGHLDGAVLMNVQDANFDQMLDTLDKSANYFIYCRSGNRSGQAIERMQAAGFTGDLYNGGSVAQASSVSGITVIK